MDRRGHLRPNGAGEGAPAGRRGMAARVNEHDLGTEHSEPVQRFHDIVLRFVAATHREILPKTFDIV